ncbi:MAG TPA: TIGR03667 family PPOX class F420-dependent oxidoreductase [Thermomicrobiales bacterium]|nr:TIGR03667 family PPOX class F420-dependent oxidoreductase [Thermomicrobiales bacterium]
MPLIDITTEFGQRVEHRLAGEQVIWLTTVRPDGTPQPSPVWFLRGGDTLLIYSQPDKPKLRNIEANPKVALSFNATPSGGDVVVFSGESPPAREHAAYIEKYQDDIQRLNSTPERFSDEYSVPIRVALTGLRGF